MFRIAVIFALLLAGTAHAVPSLDPDITVGRGDTSPPPTPTQWSCASLLEETKAWKYQQTVVGKRYKLDYQLSNGKACVGRIEVGHYGYILRNSIETNESWTPSRHNSNYTATVSFMEQAGITCRLQDGVFSLVFPDHERGHEDYRTIDLDCANEDAHTNIFIGLSEEGSDSLSIYYVHNYNTVVSHVFNVDSDGVITKHAKIIGIPIVHESVVWQRAD